MTGQSAFFYGTLMFPEILHRVIFSTSTPSDEQKNLLIIKPAVLHGFCRKKVQYASYPGIIPKEGSSVLGTFVTGLSKFDIAHLDLFEGTQYTRRFVKVKLLSKVGDAQGKGNVEAEEVEAETYEFTDGNQYLEDGEWDIEEFKKDRLREWTTTGDEYAEVDDAFAAENYHNDGAHDSTGGRSVSAQKEQRDKLAKELAEKFEEDAFRSAV